MSKTRVVILKHKGLYNLENAINTSLDSIETLNKGKITYINVDRNWFTGYYTALIVFELEGG